MTPFESGQAKIARGSFDLTNEEMVALAIASAARNPVMVPVSRDPEVQRITRAMDAVPGDFASTPAKSKMTPELIERILDITIGQDRSQARAALSNLFEHRHLAVAIDKTWDNEDAYKSIKTGR